MTTGFSRRTSSLRARFCVTTAVPQPSLTIEMWSPATSRTSSHARGPRPLSRTCVSPWCGSKSSIDLLQLLLGAFLDVVEHRVAVTVDADDERAEVLHSEPPEALGHQLFPGDLFDLLDLRRLQRRRAADDREIDHPVLAHRLDRLVGQAALAADRAHAVLRTEALREADHARRRRRADADLLVLAGTDLAHARRGVQQKRAVQIHRRLDTLVEDANVRAVTDPDDVAVDDNLVAGAQLPDLLLRRREREALRTHGRTRPPHRDRCALSHDVRPSTGS